MKYCSRCKKDKDISEFRTSKRTKDGYFVWCRDCDKAYQKEWNIKNHEKQKVYAREHKRERYNNDEEFRQKELNKHKMWYINNLDKIHEYNIKRRQNPEFLKRESERGREYREKNKEKIKEDYKNWSIKNFEKRKLYKQRYEETHREWRREKARILKAKRKRGLDFIKVCDNPFEDNEKVDWHHMNDTYVIAIPTDLHTLFQGKMHRDLLIPIIRQIYGDDIDIWNKK